MLGFLDGLSFKTKKRSDKDNEAKLKWAPRRKFKGDLQLLNHFNN